MKRKEQVYDYKVVNALLDRIERFSRVKYDCFYEDRDKARESLCMYSFVKFNPKLVTITTKYGENMLPTTYVFTRDDTPAHLKAGSEEYGIFMRAAKSYVPSFSNDPWSIKHLGKKDGKFLTKNSGILEYNKKFLHKPTYAYQYDLNSAYLSVLYRQMPDTTKPSYGGVLQEGEVGFLVTDKLILVTQPGILADIKFPLMDTPEPIKTYCRRWFERCKTNKLISKHQIVDSIGYLQYHNPYLRAYIVESCNIYIKSLYDKDHTILLNTDAIYSDIPLSVDEGLDIGQFKLKEGIMTISGLDYVSEAFGDVQRGKQKNNYYVVVNNRLRRIENEEVDNRAED